MDDILGCEEATAIAWSYIDGHISCQEAIGRLAEMGAEPDEADDFLTAESFEAQMD